MIISFSFDVYRRLNEKTVCASYRQYCDAGGSDGVMLQVGSIFTSAFLSRSTPAYEGKPGGISLVVGTVGVFGTW